MRTLTLIILLIIWPSAAYSWQWRITESANCANGQCSPVVSPSNGSAVFRSIGSPSSGVQQIAGTLDCPDGRCPLLPKQGNRSQVPSISNTPTLAPPEPRVIVQAKPVRSVMVQPVRRVIQWRPFKRLFGRR